MPKKARVEGINQQVVRVEVRLPLNLYEKIEAIANDEGMKPHHITGRPMLSPVIIDLLETALSNYKPKSNDREQLKKELLAELKKELGLGV